MLDYTLLAWLCLTAPSEPPAIFLSDHLLCAAIAQLAVDEQLWNDDEQGGYLAQQLSSEYWGNERMNLLRERWRLARDNHMPRIEDSARYPGPTTCTQQMEFCDQCRRTYWDRMSLNGRQHDPSWAIFFDEINSCYSLWTTARQATCPDVSVWERRLALQELRDRTGLKAYYDGYLPPPAPIHRFPR